MTKTRNINTQIYADIALQRNIASQKSCIISYFFTKRIADIIFSSIILFLTFPILAITAILIKIESKGPIFYLQDRVGKDGKIFKLIKLRTMYIDKDIDKNSFCTH